MHNWMDLSLGVLSSEGLLYKIFFSDRRLNCLSFPAYWPSV